MIASAALQRALYERLSALSFPFYDEVPDDAEAPYGTMGEMTEVPDDTHSESGSEETETLHFWSFSKPGVRDGRAGSTEVKEMMQEADDLLHDQPLELEGGARNWMAVREMSEVMVEELDEGETWRHGVMRYRFRTEA